MALQTPRITLTQLPPRARPLNPEELSAIFGGCMTDDSSGCTDNDYYSSADLSCCQGWTCKPGPGNRVCVKDPAPPPSPSGGGGGGW